MRILLIGKFPPLEGGVSAQTFWLASSLARQGHHVHVVTNAQETEPSLRQFHNQTDIDWLCTNQSKRLRVHSTKPVTPQSYIPFAPPYLSQLFGLALEVVEQYGCEIIISWYFEPYGLAASLVTKATGLPFFVRHAGSDLGRLANHPDLRSSYRWMLNTATGLMVTNENELKAQFGKIDTPRLKMLRPALPVVFNHVASPLDVPTLLAESGIWFQQSRLDREVIQKVLEINSKSFSGVPPVIGTYGKVGETKGSFDLLKSLSELARQGVDFTFLSMSCGRSGSLQQYYENILNDKELSRRTWILPPLGPWRVPSFLAKCQAVTFLERGFSISFHSPMMPLEVLSSGSCLVCSKEVTSKPFYRGNLVNDRNLKIVQDPRNCKELTHGLLQVINNPERSRSIGLQGRKLYQFFAEDLNSQDDSARALMEQIGNIVQMAEV